MRLGDRSTSHKRVFMQLISKQVNMLQTNGQDASSQRQTAGVATISTLWNKIEVSLPNDSHLNLNRLLQMPLD